MNRLWNTERREAEADSHAMRRDEAKKIRDRITSTRAQQLCEDATFVGDTLSDFFMEAKHGSRPASVLKAREISLLVMAGGSGEDVCDRLRAIVEGAATEKADDEYSDTFGDDE